MAEEVVNPGGPLVERVLGFVAVMKDLVAAGAASGDEWAPLREFVAVDEFERIGPFLEVQDWRQYVEMLSQWSLGTTGFETTLLRVSELRGLVYVEVEERHQRNESIEIVNSMTVFEFDETEKIRRLAVYLQRRPRRGEGHRGDPSESRLTVP